MAFASLLLLSTPGYAITIHYQATDLPDTVSGIDEWRYEYTVSEHNFAVDTGFVIFFDPLLYTGLQDPAPLVNGDWDVLVTQPEPFFTTDGRYDALALINTASLRDVFSLTFVWSGSQIPESQAFEIYDATFNAVSFGDTQAKLTTVPAPTALWLLIVGLVLVIKQRLSHQDKHNFQIALRG